MNRERRQARINQARRISAFRVGIHRGRFASRHCMIAVSRTDYFKRKLYRFYCIFVYHVLVILDLYFASWAAVRA